ncbi:maleate cis-trans isomerase family protein [Streptomyces smyrnaeus]|uniref:maleate cis-trans isomerase family protein n=1 Tax=Streptomyces smyrnaeus TaxID=1387713 RepID=UPI00368B8E18
MTDDPFPGVPQTCRSLGVITPSDFALDRELWHWIPESVSLHLTRLSPAGREAPTAQRPFASAQSLGEAVRAVSVVRPQAVAYDCAAGSAVLGRAGEQRLCASMEQAGGVPAVTTSGALVDALREAAAQRVAMVTPCSESVTAVLKGYLAEAGISVSGAACPAVPCRAWRLTYREVVGLARRAVSRDADALFVSCPNLPTYDVLPELEAELGIVVLSANQVTLRAALKATAESDRAARTRCGTSAL